MSDVIKRYVRKNWKDHLVEFPDRRYLQPVEGQPDGVVDLVKAEGIYTRMEMLLVLVPLTIWKRALRIIIED